MMTGNVVISEVDDLMCVVLSMAEKKRALWGVSWYHCMYSVINEVSHKARSF
jgi:hypothetical protein